MFSTEKPTSSFALPLIAGIFTLSNCVTLGFAESFVSETLPTLIPQHALTQVVGATELAMTSTFLYTLMAVGIAFSLIVSLGAIMLYRSPSRKTAWGIIILVFSIVSVVVDRRFLIEPVL